MNRNSKEAFILEYQPKYFKTYYENGNKFPGITKNNASFRDIEKYIVEEKLKKGIIDPYVVAWKAGRLSSVKSSCEKIMRDEDLKIQEKDGNYLNGYGRIIDKKELEKYLEQVKRKKYEITEMLRDGKYEDAYKAVNHNVPDNFGCVYMINLLYFLSEGKVPLYDRFAYRAAKALYADRPPACIYAGEAPGKKEERKVSLMYREYLWLLEHVFGKTDIERELDQALWVYGHADDPKIYFRTERKMK